MLKRLQQLLVVALLILSIGGHWAILQSGAWVSMFIAFSRTDSLAVAAVKTFDGNHPCKLCKFVKEGKDAEKKHDHQISKVKIDYYLNENPTYCWNPKSFLLGSEPPSILSDRNYPPSKPPPRFL